MLKIISSVSANVFMDYQQGYQIDSNILSYTQKNIGKININVHNSLEKLLGYQLFFPALNGFSMKKQLKDLYNIPLTTIGDNWKTCSDSNWINKIEEEVIKGYGKLFGFNPEEIRGFVGNGSTSGIIQGIYLAELKAKSENKDAKPILFCSDQSHYSVMNAAKLLNIPCIIVKSDDKGSISPKELVKTVIEEITKDPNVFPILCPVIGSTFKGADDNVNDICETMKQNGIDNYLVHIDSAFGGSLSPFMMDVQKIENKNIDELKIDFKKLDPHIISIQMSGHKAFGTNKPTGIFIVQKKIIDVVDKYLQNLKSENHEKINSNVFFQTERSAQGILEAWVLLHTFIQNGHMPHLIDHMLKLAEYIEEGLNKLNNTHPVRNHNSSTIMFDDPDKSIISNFILAEDGKGHSHIIIMPHHKKELADDFLNQMDTNHILNDYQRNSKPIPPIDLSMVKLNSDDQKKIDQLIDSTTKEIDHSLSISNYFLNKMGIQINNYQGDLADLHLNNVGDPWEPPHLKIDTCVLERKALNSIAERFNFPINTGKIDLNKYVKEHRIMKTEQMLINDNQPERQYWGFINSVPTTIMQALLVNREHALSQSSIPHFYYSDQTDPIVVSQAAVLGMDRHEIKSQTLEQSQNLPIDIDSLIMKIIENKNHYPIINLNIGSQSGAFDNVETIVNRLDNEGIHNFRIHLNASVGGNFVPEKIDFSQLDERVYSISLRILGATEPTGAVLIRNDPSNPIQEDFKNNKEIAYLKTKGQLLLCSRNGHQPLETWLLNELLFKNEKQTDLIHYSTELRNLFLDKLLENKIEAFSNPLLPIIYLKTPSPEIVEKWHLKPISNNESFIFIRPDMTINTLMSFLHDLSISDKKPG